MIGDQIWAKNVLIALEYVYDEKYQRRSWTGIGPEVSSPSEMFNVLFNDCSIDKFISHPPEFVTRETIRRIQNLACEMEPIEVDDANPELLLDSPLWSKVREAALSAAESLRRDLRPN